MKRIRFVLLFALMFGFAVVSGGQVMAEPLPPLGPDASNWNNYCHSQGNEGDALTACCTQFGDQCHGKCASSDQTCNNQCEHARHDCIEAGIVQKGIGSSGKPVTPGKPIEERAR